MTLDDIETLTGSGTTTELRCGGKRRMREHKHRRRRRRFTARVTDEAPGVIGDGRLKHSGQGGDGSGVHES